MLRAWVSEVRAVRACANLRYLSAGPVLSLEARWKLVNERVRAESRGASDEKKLAQLESLMTVAIHHADAARATTGEDRVPLGVLRTDDICRSPPLIRRKRRSRGTPPGALTSDVTAPKWGLAVPSRRKIIVASVQLRRMARSWGSERAGRVGVVAESLAKQVGTRVDRS